VKEVHFEFIFNVYSDPHRRVVIVPTYSMKNTSHIEFRSENEVVP